MTNARRYVGPIDDNKAIATKDYVDNLDDKYLLLENAFLNFKPKIGLADDEKSEMYAKPNFTFLPTLANDHIWMDNQSRYIMYFLAHDGIAYHHDMYRGYSYNLEDSFIFDNEPCKPTFVDANEYIGFIHCITHNSIVFSTYLKSNKTYSKTYFVNTNGYSKSELWTDYVDITSIASYASNFVACFKNNTKYIAVYNTTTEVTVVLFDSSLTKIENSDKVIFNILTNINYTNIPNFDSLRDSNISGKLYASYNILNNELIISFRILLTYFTLTSSVYTYRYNTFWFNFNISNYISSNGSSNPVNTRLSDNNNEVYDIETETKGMRKNNDIIKTMYDIYTKTYRMIMQNPWNYGGPLVCREYSTDWDFNFNNNLISSNTIYVLDASPWAKNLDSNFYFIDDNETYQGDNCGTIIFRGRSSKYDYKFIIAKVSTTSFNNIANSSLNSLKIKPGAWRFLSDIYTTSELSLLQNKYISTYIPLSTKVAVRYISTGAEGQPIFRLQRNDTNPFKYDFIDTNKTIPTINSYDASIPVNWCSNYQIFNNFAGYNPDQNVVYIYVYKNIDDEGVDIGYEKVCRIMKVRLSDNKAIAISGYIGKSFKSSSPYDNGLGLNIFNSLIINNNTEDTHYTSISYSYPGNTVFRPFKTNFLNQDEVSSFLSNSSLYGVQYFSYCKNLGVVYEYPSTPASNNNGYISLRTEELVTSDVSLSTINLAMSCVSSVGLIVTIPSFYVFIGGFMTRSESGEFLLEANTRSYICIERDYTDPKNRNRLSKIVIYTSPVPNSFSRICIGEILTNNTDIIEQIIYET
jgi:hypothetical protein